MNKKSIYHQTLTWLTDERNKQMTIKNVWEEKGLNLTILQEEEKLNEYLQFSYKAYDTQILLSDCTVSNLHDNHDHCHGVTPQVLSHVLFHR